MSASPDFQKGDRGPLVQFARFSDSRIEVFHAHTTEHEYIAISHVWGRTEWLWVESLGRETLISAKKARFVETRLRSLVGTTAFWMDTLTVDQRDPAEVISTVQAIPAIPAIFKDAVKTIAIREGDGFFDCCAESIRNAADFKDISSTLISHVHKHFATNFQESYLQRLWTLQEILLSKNVDFVADFREPADSKSADQLVWHVSDPDGRDDLPPSPENFDVYAGPVSAATLLDSLFVTAHAFNQYPDPIDENSRIIKFIRAYIQNGSVSRTNRPHRTTDEDIFTHHFLIMHSASTRRATEPRDYIFATMPQFPWYHYPGKAAEMSFSSIFLDFYEQSCAAGHPLTCRITRSMTNPNSLQATNDEWQPSRFQPEPQCLGDFLKLLGRKTTVVESPETYYVAAKVSVIDLHAFDLNSTINLILSAMSFSSRIWRESSRCGELGKYGSDPESTRNYDDLPTDFHGENETAEHQEWRQGKERLRDIKVKEDKMRWADEGWIFEEAYKILNLMWLGNNTDVSRGHSSDWVCFMQLDAAKMWTIKLQETLLLMAAMISCQLPASAVEWTRERFIPTRVSHADKELLCLLAKHAWCDELDSGQDMYIVGRHQSIDSLGQDLVLATVDNILPVGLVPDFIHVDATDRDLIAYNASMWCEGYPDNVNKLRAAKR